MPISHPSTSRAKRFLDNNISKSYSLLSKSAFMIAALLTLAGCSKNQETAETANVESAKAEMLDVAEATETTGEVLRIGTEGAYAPFNYTNPDGSLGGFDVEIANALCDDMQITCDIVAQDWDGIIPGLKAGKYDAIVAAMSITAERAEQVDFSEPYFSNALVFLAKKDSSFDPNNSLDISTQTIAAQRSTISSQWLETSYPSVNIQLYDTLSNAFLDLGSNRVEAMISDKLPAVEWLSSASGSSYAIKGDDIDINDKFAIAVRLDDPLLARINQSLNTIKSNGTYDKINQKYFAYSTSANVDSTTNSNTDAVGTDATNINNNADIANPTGQQLEADSVVIDTTDP